MAKNKGEILHTFKMTPWKPNNGSIGLPIVWLLSGTTAFEIRITVKMKGQKTDGKYLKDFWR